MKLSTQITEGKQWPEGHRGVFVDSALLHLYYYLINIVNIQILSLNFFSKTTKSPLKAKGVVFDCRQKMQQNKINLTFLFYGSIYQLLVFPELSNAYHRLLPRIEKHYPYISVIFPYINKIYYFSVS